MSYVCKQPYIHTLTYEKCWIQACSRIVLQYWPSKFSHRLNFLTVNGWLEISKQRSNTGLWRSLQSLDSIPQRMWIDPTWSDHDTHTRTLEKPQRARYKTSVRLIRWCPFRYLLRWGKRVTLLCQLRTQQGEPTKRRQNLEPWTLSN